MPSPLRAVACNNAGCMRSRDVGIETLLLLMKKARLRIRKYEALRTGGDNREADEMIPQMFALRADLIAALNGARRSDDPEERPNAKVTEEVNGLMRALAPGMKIRRSSAEETTVVRRSRFHYDEATVVGPRMTVARPSGTRTTKLERTIRSGPRAGKSTK